MKHSLNDAIRVRLTDYGREIYAQQLRAINKLYGREVFRNTEPFTDEEGYTEFRLWDFMYTFGIYTYMGNNDIVIEDLEFEFTDTRDGWYTGTPDEEGVYLCRMNSDFAPWAVLDWKDGMWFVNGTTQSFPDDGDVRKWMMIEEGKDDI